MAVPWMAIAAGSSLLSGLMSFGADKAAAKAQRAFQKYRNTMTQLSNALAQDAITANELISNEQFRRQALQIQSTYQEAAGATQVQAGATDTAGRSVDRSMFLLEQSRDMAEAVRQENLISSWIAFDQQRENAAMSAAMQQDYSYIPKPNLMTYLFKAGTQIGQMGHEAGWFNK